jgi:hypothetical protein
VLMPQAMRTAVNALRFENTRKLPSKRDFA